MPTPCLWRLSTKKMADNVDSVDVTESKLKINEFPKPYIDKQRTNIEFKLSQESYAVRSRGCLVWKRCRDPKKYPSVTWTHPNTALTHRRSTFGLHTVIFFIFTGKVTSPGQDISHLCGNRHCVEIQHLSLESHALNVKRTDCHFKGHCLGHENAEDCLFIECKIWKSYR